MPSYGIHTSNLPATIAIEFLSAEHVAEQQQGRQSQQQLDDIVAVDWNAVYAVVGSFADEHSTL